MNQLGKIPAIVENHVKTLAFRKCSKGLFDTPSVFFFSFAFPCVNRNTGSSNTKHRYQSAMHDIEMQYPEKYAYAAAA